MKMRWVFCAQLWACQALAIEPGQGFGVHLDWPLVAQHVQSLEPLDLHFRVEQCEQFSTIVQHRSVYGDDTRPDAWRSLPVDAQEDGHGRHVVRLGVGALLDDGAQGCWSDAEHPDRQEVRVAVTCDGDGRQAVSAPIPLIYAPAAHFVPHWGSEVLGLEVVDGNRLVLASAAGVHMVHLDRRGEWGGVPEVSHGVGLGGGDHAMAHTATHAYVASACMYPRCTPVTVEDPVTHARLSLQSADVFSIDLQRSFDPNDNTLITGMTQVPGPIVHLFADSDGSILVVSRPANPSNALGGLGQLGGVWTPGLVVSRITEGVVSTEAVLEDESPIGTEMTSQGVFLTGNPNSLVHMRRVQAPHAKMRLRLGATDIPWTVWPSPDGRHWLVAGKDRDDVCEAATGECHRLESVRRLEHWGFGQRPAWLSDGMARKVDEADQFGVEVFNLDGTLRGTATHPRKHMTDIGLLRPVLALSGDRVALTETDRVAIFDRMGRPLGGTSLPPHCGVPVMLQELPGDRLAWVSAPPMPAVYVMNLAELQ